MQKMSLEALARELFVKARSGNAGRAAETVFGGHERSLRQTLVAIVAGSALAEHESPGDATVQVLIGRVRVTAGENSWEGRTGDLIVIPAERHDLAALEDACVLLTVSKPVR